jgi:hypothetical protein
MGAQDRERPFFFKEMIAGQANAPHVIQPQFMSKSVSDKALWKMVF